MPSTYLFAWLVISYMMSSFSFTVIGLWNNAFRMKALVVKLCCSLSFSLVLTSWLSFY